jgi:hypothetical protein
MTEDGSFTGKTSGFHVLRVAVGESKPPEVRLRCFAIVSEPLPPPAGKEIEVITDEFPLQLALSVGATMKCEVEVAYDESEGLKRLHSVRMLDR